VAPPPSSPFSGFQAYGGFTGGVSVAVGNLDGDPQDEIVTGAGPGGGPHVKVFDVSASGVPTEKLGFFAYDPGFTGGVHVAVGDVNGDGTNDIITGAGAGGGPHVKVFNANGTQQGPGFFAYGANFTGGVYVAAGQVDGDVEDDIITGAGAGGGPHVKVFNATGTPNSGGMFVYGATFTGGVRVAAGNVDGTGTDEIITGAGPGGGPHVKVFTSDGTSTLGSFFAYDGGFTGGVYVAAGNVVGASSSSADVITGAGAGGGPHVRVFNANGTLANNGYFAYDPSFAGGVTVAAGDVVSASGETSGGEVVTGPASQADGIRGHRFSS
jgi:hypothetical protein